MGLGELLERHALKLRPLSVQAFGFAVLAVVAATALRYAFADLFGATLYFSSYYPAILVVATFAGPFAAAAATLMSLLVVWWAFYPPEFSFNPLAATDYANFALFVVSISLVIALAHLYRLALARLLQKESERELLLREMHHRAGNSLAVVQAIVNSTLRDEPNKAAVIGGRLRAMMSANDLVLNADTQGAELVALLRSELAPYALNERVTIEGPAVHLSGQAARNIALVIHELTTNAVKHGALSTPDGKLRIGWQPKDDTVDLQWEEIDGPTVPQPERIGQGTRMMRASLAAVSGSKVSDYRPEGLLCRISFRPG